MHSDAAARPDTLLLVDDEPQICAALKRILHKEGYRIHIAGGPAEAHAILAGNAIDVIVCDQRMPEKQGTEFLREVRDLYPHTVRMILSGAAEVKDVAGAMTAGIIYKFLTKPIDPELLRANVREAFSRAASSAGAAVGAHPSFDNTTGLPTRQFLQGLFQEMSASGREEGKTVCMLMVKVDQHQNVVSSFGRSFSRRFLRAVAQRLTAGLSGEHFLCHDSPGTFILLLTDADPEGCIARADLELDRLFAAPVEAGGRAIAVTVSVGATAAAEHSSFDELLDQVHTAMVTGSDRGGGTMQFYQPQLVKAFRGQLEMESDLRQALAAEAFEIYYQPQVEIETGRLAGVEALLRWQHPERGYVSPAEFIPVAERIGLIGDLGGWVLDRAVARLAAWRRAGCAPQELAINVSALQMKDMSFIERVRTVLARFDLPPERLVLEVTESAALGVGSSVEECLQGLGGLGVTLAIDDFGTGYANLGNLRHLAVKKVKVDRSLLPSHRDERSGRLFANVVGMARELGLDAVAEGVETERELAAVRAARCPVVQGYLYSPALSVRALTPRLGKPFHPNVAGGLETR